MDKTRFLVMFAMTLFTVASMATTYMSLEESVLPGPKVPIPIGAGQVWDCSWLALAISVGIGLLLFGLKVAIIDEQKRLSVAGLAGLFIVAFISISFNMDVFYRWADQDFFLRFSNAQVKSVYAGYLAEAGAKLTERRENLQRTVARQEAELSAEVDGLREAPEGFGPRARKEEYTLRVLESESRVELDSIQEAIQVKARADEILVRSSLASLDELDALQDELRVACMDVGAKVGMPLPEPVRLRTPFFAVFSRIFDFKSIGVMEVFILLLAILLDLGDIIGYNLIPDRKRPRPRALAAMPPVTVEGPEIIPEFPANLPGNDPGEAVASGETDARRTRRAFRFRRRP